MWARLVSSSEVQAPISDYSDEGRIRNEERRRFLQELHDGPIQTATALMIYEQVPNMESMRQELLGRLTREMRVLMSTSPVERLSQRLDEAVQQFRQQMEQYTNIPVTVTVTGEGNLKKLPPSKAAVLYHVVQEGLSNVSKHSGATEARVRIACSDTSTRVSVEDNGKGFDQSSLQERWDVPHGITLLKQRIESLGGSLRLGTSGGKGTMIEAQMPHQ
jgi:signal transduction histidine kinase